MPLPLIPGWKHCGLCIRGLGVRDLALDTRQTTASITNRNFLTLSLLAVSPLSGAINPLEPKHPIGGTIRFRLRPGPVELPVYPTENVVSLRLASTPCGRLQSQFAHGNLQIGPGFFFLTRVAEQIAG